MNERYVYADFEEYFCISDTKEASKTLDDFKQELIGDDYD